VHECRRRTRDRLGESHREHAGIDGAEDRDPHRDTREHGEVEHVTDLLCRPIVEGLGDDCEELVATLGTWSAAVQAAGGYPASGPHDLAGLTGAGA
jgi:hypothetical protein